MWLLCVSQQFSAAPSGARKCIVRKVGKCVFCAVFSQFLQFRGSKWRAKLYCQESRQVRFLHSFQPDSPVLFLHYFLGGGGLGGVFLRKNKSQRHPKDFPGGPPPQYYPGLATVNFRVRVGSGVFDAVWPLATLYWPKNAGIRVTSIPIGLRVPIKKPGFIFWSVKIVRWSRKIRQM